MISDAFSQMLVVSIEAFAALFGITAAFFIYRKENLNTRIQFLREHMQSNMRELGQTYSRLLPDFYSKYPDFENRKILCWGAHVQFRRQIEEIEREIAEQPNTSVDYRSTDILNKGERRQISLQVRRDLRASGKLEKMRNETIYSLITLAIPCIIPIFITFIFFTTDDI